MSPVGQLEFPVPKCERCGRPSRNLIGLHPIEDDRFVLMVCDPPVKRYSVTPSRSCARALLKLRFVHAPLGRWRTPTVGEGVKT